MSNAILCRRAAAGLHTSALTVLGVRVAAPCWDWVRDASETPTWLCTASSLVGCRAAQPKEQCIVAMSYRHAIGSHIWLYIKMRTVAPCVQTMVNGCLVFFVPYGLHTCGGDRTMA